MLILFKLYTFSVYCSLTKLKKTKTKKQVKMLANANVYPLRG